MSPRLTVCFGLSVLLHGALLLSVAPALRSGGKRYLPSVNVEARKLEVLLKAESGKAKPSGKAAQTARSAKPEAASPAPVKPLLIPPPGVAATAQPASGPGWLVHPPPDSRNLQMNYQRNYEMQARQQAIQQARMFAARLQADIEQSISLRGEPVAGRCDWRENSPTFQCSPMTLQHWMQPESDRLRALRDARRMLGNPIEGFAIGIGDNGASITLYAHSEASEDKH